MFFQSCKSFTVKIEVLVSLLLRCEVVLSFILLVTIEDILLALWPTKC